MSNSAPCRRCSRRRPGRPPGARSGRPCRTRRRRWARRRQRPRPVRGAYRPPVRREAFEQTQHGCRMHVLRISSSTVASWRRDLLPRLRQQDTARRYVQLRMLLRVPPLPGTPARLRLPLAVGVGRRAAVGRRGRRRRRLALCRIPPPPPPPPPLRRPRALARRRLDLGLRVAPAVRAAAAAAGRRGRRERVAHAREHDAAGREHVRFRLLCTGRAGRHGGQRHRDRPALRRRRPARLRACARRHHVGRQLRTGPA